MSTHRTEETANKPFNVSNLLNYLKLKYIIKNIIQNLRSDSLQTEVV